MRGRTALTPTAISVLPISTTTPSIRTRRLTTPRRPTAATARRPLTSTTASTVDTGNTKDTVRTTTTTP